MDRGDTPSRYTRTPLGTFTRPRANNWPDAPYNAPPEVRYADDYPSLSRQIVKAVVFGVLGLLRLVSMFRVLRVFRGLPALTTEFTEHTKNTEHETQNPLPEQQPFNSK